MSFNDYIWIGVAGGVALAAAIELCILKWGPSEDE